MNRKRYGPALIVLCWLHEARYVFLTWAFSIEVAIVTAWWMGLPERQRSTVIAAIAAAFGLFVFVGFVGCLFEKPRPSPKTLTRVDHERIRAEVLRMENERCTTDDRAADAAK